MTPTTGLWSLVEMGNVLQQAKQQQIVALGRLQWPLRRIEEATGVRRETISAYLKAAGIAVRGRGRPGERPAKPAISPPAVSTDPPSPAAVGHAKTTPLKGLRFESIEAAQTYLDRWETRWADTRIHGTTKRQVAVMFTEERPHLGGLPVEPFRYS